MHLWWISVDKPKPKPKSIFIQIINLYYISTAMLIIKIVCQHLLLLPFQLKIVKLVNYQSSFIIHDIYWTKNTTRYIILAPTLWIDPKYHISQSHLKQKFELSKWSHIVPIYSYDKSSSSWVLSRSSVRRQSEGAIKLQLQ